MRENAIINLTLGWIYVQKTILLRNFVNVEFKRIKRSRCDI